MFCSIHHAPIKGRVYRWNHRVMCGRCYRYFSKHVRVIPNWPRARSAQPKPQRVRHSWLSRLRRALW